MKFCASLAFTDTEDYVALAQIAEEHGWDTLVLSDHVVHPEKIDSRYPYREDGERPWEAPDHWPDNWVAMAAMGAVTRRLRFLTGVYVVPMRHPFHLAKAIGTAAVLTDYRVSLGLGLGWMRDEFELLGEEFDTRAARTTEMIEVMRKLWSGEMVEHRGRFFDFGRLNMRPAVRGPIPLLVGGVSDAALRRTARIGDGWIPHAISTAEARSSIAAIRRRRAELGRDEQPLTAIVPLTDAFDPDGYRRAEDAGVTHALTTPWMLYGGSHRSFGDKRDGLRRFADDVIAKMG
ncbi:MAG TPA: LLM class F420-dependent oxidoreductase [Myxococcota bacterium]|nr:LLM class F420-dependent oxidoreductase [Myxococcota bacterium]